MIDLKGIEYVIMAGAGAILGLVLGVPIMAALATFFPVLWPWILAPCGAGAVLGLVVARFIQ